MDAKRLTKQAITAALYAVLTWALAGLSYGPIQFRLSEILTLLAWVNPVYIPGLVVGTVLANLTSPLGMLDVVVGAGSSFIAFLLMRRTRSVWVASLWPTVMASCIAAELAWLSGQPASFFLYAAQILFSQFVVVTVLGVPLLRTALKNPTVHRLLDPVESR